MTFSQSTLAQSCILECTLQQCLPMDMVLKPDVRKRSHGRYLFCTEIKYKSVILWKQRKRSKRGYMGNIWKCMLVN